MLQKNCSCVKMSLTFPVWDSMTAIPSSYKCVVLSLTGQLLDVCTDISACKTCYPCMNLWKRDYIVEQCMRGLSAFAQILGYRLFSLTYSNICLMARPEDLVLYKVMPTRDIVKCSSINMTNARLISSRKHKLPSQRVAYLRQTTGAKKHREYISIYSYTIVSVDTSVRSIH